MSPTTTFSDAPLLHRTSRRFLLLGLVVAVLVAWVPEGPVAAARSPGDDTVSLVQSGQKTRGFYVSMQVRGTSWTVTIRPMNQRGVKTYPLAADVRLAYRGEFIPWQSGVTAAAVVELLLDQGEVRVINILAPSS